MAYIPFAVERRLSHSLLEVRVGAREMFDLAAFSFLIASGVMKWPWVWPIVVAASVGAIQAWALSLAQTGYQFTRRGSLERRSARLIVARAIICTALVNSIIGSVIYWFVYFAMDWWRAPS